MINSSAPVRTMKSRRSSPTVAGEPTIEHRLNRLSSAHASKRDDLLLELRLGGGSGVGVPAAQVGERLLHATSPGNRASSSVSAANDVDAEHHVRLRRAAPTGWKRAR